MSGDWPPEWDDPEEELPLGADQLDAATEARLAEVTAYLASVPAPALPDVISARISAAIAAEATARAGRDDQDEATAQGGAAPAAATAPADGGRTLGSAPARARVRRRQGGSRDDRRFRLQSVLKVSTSVLAGLVVLAGVGYGLSHVSSSSSSSSSSSVAAGSAPENFAQETPASAPAAAASASSGAGSSAVPQFTVSASGTRYQAATLRSQVRVALAHPLASTALGPSRTSPPVPSPAPSSQSASARAQVPTAALRGCVLHLTRGQPPRLVDRATYQGKPVYVIATSSRVWVVGLGCTAANAELITSGPLGS